MDRPKTVTTSVLASAVACGAGMIHLFITKGANASLITIGVWAFASWLVLLYLRAIWRGRRWAWWLQLFFGAYGLITLPWISVPPGVPSALFISQYVICAIATLLLLPARSRAWFRPNNSFKPKPLRGSA
jgi:membrane-bound metal-dependent hydrolase YbcI (DUF457 family)